MQFQKQFGVYAIGALFGSVLALTGPQTANAADPFSRLVGTWSGSGQILLGDGKRERITCKAYYVAKDAGSGLGLAIRCASSSFKIEMRGQLTHQGNRVTGQWEERSFNASGNVNGQSSEGGLSLAISGGVSGAMTVTIGPSGHRVDIRTTTAGLAGVSISLTRS